jgi:hypothetical protein
MTSEVLYDPLSARKFNLYYIHKGSKALVVTVTISIDANGDELCILKQEPTVVPDHVGSPDALSPHKGLYFDKSCRDGGVQFLAMPLRHLTPQGPSRALRMFLSYKEFKWVSQANEIDVDEASGRVIIWGWDRKSQEAKIFVGDLV